MSLRIFCLLLMLLSLPLRAAEPEAAPADDAASATGTAPATDEQNPDAAAQDAAIAEEIRAAEEAAANAPPPDPNEPFIPTVQISEDLSVSFPVDI
jgi:hypothetical protein